MIFDTQPPMRYELWQSADGCAQAYFRADNDAARAQLEPNASMIWSCVAESYLDAQQQRHRHLGYEPYRPLEDSSET